MAFSRMNFRSLYFWLASYALSERVWPSQRSIETRGEDRPSSTRRGGKEEGSSAPYFHPRTSPHFAHMTSRTVCKPVVIGRSSAGPQVMLTLRRGGEQTGECGE